MFNTFAYPDENNKLLRPQAVPCEAHSITSHLAAPGRGVRASHRLLASASWHSDRREGSQPDKSSDANPMRPRIPSRKPRGMHHKFFLGSRKTGY
jgi:hypothetical protein